MFLTSWKSKGVPHGASWPGSSDATNAAFAPERTVMGNIYIKGAAGARSLGRSRARFNRNKLMSFSALEAHRYRGASSFGRHADVGATCPCQRWVAPYALAVVRPVLRWARASGAGWEFRV